MEAVLLALCSAFCFAAGHSLQKHGVSRSLGRGSGRTGIARLLQPTWLAGIATIVLASALDLQAVSLGDLTLVKPVLGLQAAFSVGLGVGFLGERVSRGEAVAIALLVVGAGAVAMTATPEVRSAPGMGSSTGIFATSLLLVVALCSLHYRVPERLGGEVAFGLAAGLMYGVSDFMMKRATIVVASDTGSFSVLDPASLLALVRTPEVLWIVAANTIAFAAIQVAFARGRVAVINPLASLTGTGFAVGLGFLLLHEPISLARAAGIALVLGATAALLVAVPGGPNGGGDPTA